MGGLHTVSRLKRFMCGHEQLLNDILKSVELPILYYRIVQKLNVKGLQINTIRRKVHI